MNQTDLQTKNDLLAQISALRASIKSLEMLNKPEYDDLIKSNKETLGLIEKEYKVFMEDVETRKAREIEEQQVQRQKQIQDDFKTINKYLKYVAGLKPEDRPELEKLNEYKSLVRRPHIVRRLKILGLK